MDNIFLTVEPLKDFIHGFFGRKGGESAGIFSSLNCQLGPPYYVHRDLAIKNFQHAQNHLGIPNKTLCNIMLEHADNVYEPSHKNSTIPHADTSISASPDIILAITSADCAPVLMADPVTRTVSAIHVGWRGAHLNILNKVITMFAKHGVPSARLRAGIGPCIAQDHLVLDSHIKQSFLEKDRQALAFFDNNNLDLGGYIEHQLTQAGVRTYERILIDTYQNLNFFSARRARHKGEFIFGAQPSLITSGGLA